MVEKLALAKRFETARKNLHSHACIIIASADDTDTKMSVAESGLYKAYRCIMHNT